MGSEQMGSDQLYGMILYRRNWHHIFYLTHYQYASSSLTSMATKMPELENAIDPVDALKTLDKILVVDPRNRNIAMESWHAQIAEITLTDATPNDVKQIFENAKNIALYAYFAYNLHQPAELISYSALEKALKAKFEQEKEHILFQRTPKTLEQYMDLALEQGWITDEGYESSRHIAIQRIQTRWTYEIIKQGILKHGESIPVPEPNENEVISEMRSMGIAKKRLHAGRHVRNFMAHGDTGLSPSSAGTLANIAEEINQLFPQRD